MNKASTFAMQTKTKKKREVTMNLNTKQILNGLCIRMAKIFLTSISLASLASGHAYAVFISDGPTAAVDFDLATATDVNSDHIYNFCPSGSPFCVNGNFLITGTRVVLNPWNPIVTMTITLTVQSIGAPSLGAGYQNILCSYDGLASDSGFTGYSASAINHACPLPAPLLYSQPGSGLGGYYIFRYSARSSGNGGPNDTGTGQYFLEGSYTSQDPSTIPEPASVCLVGAAIAGLALLRRGQMKA